MGETIILNIAVQVPHGPSLTSAITLDVPAYDKISAVIPKSVAADNETTIQASGDSTVRFFCIVSDNYGPKEESNQTGKLYG